MPVEAPETLPADSEVPARYDPADPIGSGPETDATAPTEPPRPPIVVIEHVVAVREELPSQWSVIRTTLAGEEVRRVAGRHDGRRSLVIKNAGPGTAYIGADTSLSTTAASWPLGVNEALTVNSTAPVYALADPAGVPTLILMGEYDRRPQDG